MRIRFYPSVPQTFASWRRWAVFAAVAAFLGSAPVDGEDLPLHGRTPDVYRYAKQILPDTIDLLGAIRQMAALERRVPFYASISFGKDEYVYHLSDRVFIRCVKNRWELPAWRLCGDFAMVRIELMDESMKTLGTVMGWHMIFRDGRWRRLFDGGDGHFTSDSLQSIELPPYAERCYNLDRKEVFDVQ